MQDCNQTIEKMHELEKELVAKGYQYGWHKPKKFVGWIYIAVNPSFKEVVKIGYGDDLKNRIKGLSGTNVLQPYHCYAAYKVTERLEDKTLHRLIDRLNPGLRYDPGKEFYTITLEDAFGILSSIASISGTSSQLELNPLDDDYFKQTPTKAAVAEKAAKESNVQGDSHEPGRKSWTFAKLGIKTGEPLQLVGNPAMVCHVHDENSKLVDYLGQTYTLSKLAVKLKDSLEGGPRNFKYNGRLVEEIVKATIHPD